MAKAAYTPFDRGQYPVGVASATVEVNGARSVKVELWYPARGRDGTEWDHYAVIPGMPGGRQRASRGALWAKGRFPALVFSHGFGSHRRQSSFLCSHLASRGYVVASPDHKGNTTVDVVNFAIGRVRLSRQEKGQYARDVLVDRPADVRATLDWLESAYTSAVDTERAGVFGHSFGGWTALKAVAEDARFCATVPMAPAGGRNGISDTRLYESLSFDFDAPVLLLALEEDSVLPLEGMQDLFNSIRGPKQLVVLNAADHFHFCDGAQQIHQLFRTLPAMPGVPLAKPMPPWRRLCPAEHGVDVAKLATAHFDAHLKHDDGAADYLAENLLQSISERGIGATDY